MKIINILCDQILSITQKFFLDAHYKIISYKPFYNVHNVALSCNLNMIQFEHTQRIDR